MDWLRWIAAAACAALPLTSLPAGAQPGSIDRAGDALRGSSDDGEPRTRTRSRSDEDARVGDYDHHHHHHDHDDYDDQGLTELTLWATAYVIASPWLIPHLVLRDAPVAGFADYPYDRDGGSRMVYPERSQDSSHDHALRLGLDGTLHDGGAGAALDAQLDLRFPLAFKLRARGLHESSADAQLESDRWAAMSEFDLLYRFAQSRHVSFYTGVGYAQWNDRHGLVPGGVVYYGFEVYPVQPLSFGSQVSAGVLGESYVVQWRSHLGVLVGRVETQLAFDYLNVAGEEFAGPMLGLQFHL